MSKLVYPEAPPERLATLRILIGAYGLFYVLGRAPAFWKLADYAPSQFEPVGPVVLLSAPMAAGALYLLIIATAGLGAAFALGWRFRWTAPAYAAGLTMLLSYRNSWGMVFHTENLIVMHTIVLALAPSADAWSADARGRPIPAPSGRYGWAIALLSAITVTSYFIAGFTKVARSGIGWVTSDTLRNFISYDNVRKIELGAGHSFLGALLVKHDWIFPPLAAVSLGLELGAPLALLSKRVGRVWCVLAWGFHVGVVFLMFIFFHYPLLGVAYASFFDVEKPAAKLIRLIRPRGPPP